MTEQGQFALNGQFTSNISSSQQLNHEVVEQKVNQSEIISLDSDDEVQDDPRNNVPTLMITNNTERRNHPVIPSMQVHQVIAQPLQVPQLNQSLPLHQPVLQSFPVHQQVVTTLTPQNTENPVQVKAYSQLIEVIDQLSDAVKSLKRKFERSTNKNKRKRVSKKRRRSKRYSTDSDSSHSSSSYERRRKKHRKSSHSYRKRRSRSKTSSEREKRTHHRRRRHSRHDKSNRSSEQNQNVVGVSSTINSDTPPIPETNILSRKNYPSTSNQSSRFRQNPMRMSRSERAIIDISEDNNSSIESLQNQRPKSISIGMRRKSTINKPATIEDIHRPPNIDNSLYFKSKNALNCQICKKDYMRIVAHYRRVHENSEVYVSRLSPKMTEKVRYGIYNLKFITNAKPPKETIRANCFFCEEQKTFPVHYWFDHLRSHTGEYAFECESCKQTAGFVNSQLHGSDCKGTWRKIVNDDLHQNFEAYICRICNYVQINEDNLIKHLEREHKYNETYGNYEQINLLPKYRKDPFTDEYSDEDMDE